MPARRRHYIVVLLLALLAAPTFGESNASQGGFVFHERLFGSANDIGVVTRLDSAAGYNFNRYFGIDLGLPVYFVRPSGTYTSTLGVASRNGIGNLYASLRFQALNPTVNFGSVLTATAPTGDKETGFSTGRPTYDWTNHLDHSFGRFTPFANAGIANTISDTPFFIRPFTTLGFVGHFEGGAEYRLFPKVGVGASAYDVAPSGRQTIVSRVAHTNPGSAQGRRASANSNHRQPIETMVETVGDASLVSDHGFSTWVSLRPSLYLNLEVGYSHSAPYALDTLFFGLGVNVGSLAKEIRH